MATYAMGSKAAAALERWNRERTMFASTVAELSREGGQTVTALEVGGAVAQLVPLLGDTLPHVAHTAAFALGRMAQASPSVARSLVDEGVAATLVGELAAPLPASPALEEELQPRRYEQYGQHRTALFALRCVARHSPDLASAVLAGDGLSAVAGCLGSVDIESKEGAASLLEIATGHGPELAALVASDPSVIPLLVAGLGTRGCPSSPGTGGKAASSGYGQYKDSPPAGSALPCIAASALANLAKSDEALARAVVEAGALPALAAAFRIPSAAADSKLLRQLAALATHIAKAAPDLCAFLVGAGLLPDLVTCLARTDDTTARRFAAATLREAARADEPSARAVADAPGALPALVAAVQGGLLPAVMAAGFVGSWSADLAERLASAGLLPPLAAVLAGEGTDEAAQTSKAAAVWALGQLAKHSAATSIAVAGTGALPRMVALAAAPTSGEDLRGKCEKALQAAISVLEDIAVLAALLELALPQEVMSVALERCAAVLESAPTSKALFVQAGALRRAEELGEAPESPHADVVKRLCSVFPEDVVNLESPAYRAAAIAKLAIS